MSGDVGCPRCLGEMVGEGPYPRAMWVVACNRCGFTGPLSKSTAAAFESCRNLCWLEVRPRLPTPEEEAALVERHGEGAGWMVIIDEGPKGLGDDLRTWQTWDAERMQIWREILSAPQPEWASPPWKIRAYAFVDARPVAWPTPDARGTWNAMPPDEVK